MRKYLANVTALLASVCIPPMGLLWLANITGWNVRWAIPVVVGLGMLFGFELVSICQSRKFVWTSISSWRDRVVFAVGLMTLLLIGVWPIQQRIGSIWLQLLSLVLGCIAALAVFHIFGTVEMKELLRCDRTERGIEAKENPPG